MHQNHYTTFATGSAQDICEILRISSPPLLADQTRRSKEKWHFFCASDDVQGSSLWITTCLSGKGYNMSNLAQIAQQIREEYSNRRSYSVLAEQIDLKESGHLSTGKNEFFVAGEALDQLAQGADIPRPFFRRIQPDLRAIVFNRCFQLAVSRGRVPRAICLNLNRDMQVIGFDDSSLLRIGPVQLMEVVCSSLPSEKSAEHIDVAEFDLGSRRLSFSCFSPQILGEPRAGDIINGGVDVVHHLCGDAGTQISCYLRRLVCQNGAIAHVCSQNRQLRARRLNNGRFDEKDMLRQIGGLLVEAWAQLREKLDVVTHLLEEEPLPLDVLRQQRTRFSLNNRMLRAIESAARDDELGPTNTRYDTFNAISRVATHDASLSLRQRRTLTRMAGEFSQQAAHRCSQCGQWIVEPA